MSVVIDFTRDGSFAYFCMFSSEECREFFGPDCFQNGWAYLVENYSGEVALYDSPYATFHIPIEQQACLNMHVYFLESGLAGYCSFYIG